MSARPATLMDVAKEAGVSLASVSRALNGSAREVSDQLSERVFDAANRLGYTPNAQAQSMARGGSTDVVGLMVNDIADPYFSTIAAGLTAAAEQHGLLVMLCSTGGQPERELELLAALRKQRGRAIVLAGSRLDDRAHLRKLSHQVEQFAAVGGRMAAISEPRLPMDTVVVENKRAARDLAVRIGELGYRRPAILTGPDKLLVARHRRDGFLDGWTGKAPVVLSDEFSRDGGFAATQRLLDSRDEVDCVFAINDLMAMGAMAACRERDLEIPRDLAVAGFDDISTLRDVSPALTTVRLPLIDMGRMALDIVCDDPAAKPRRRKVRGEVIVRESTPPR